MYLRRLCVWRTLASIAAALAFFNAQSLRAQSAVPARSAITGISHIAYFTSDLNKAIAFWHELLGFDEDYQIDKSGTNQIRTAFIKINDHQHIELLNEPSPDPPNIMSHVCFTVSNVEQMRAYLRSRGFNVKTGNPGNTRAGNYAVEVKDPDGTIVEFVQAPLKDIETPKKGEFLPSSRISHAIYHVGFLGGCRA